jgi:GNAT superfamily N-acetyltransferase
LSITLEKPCGPWQWAQIHALYLTAFPAAERKPFGIIRKMFRQGGTHVWRILRSGKFAGFAATVNGDGLILLDYLAVCKTCRGQGIGAAAMRQLLEIYHDKGLFVEIESTRTGQTRQQKRKAFYLGVGLEDLGTSAMVFGVPMDLLGIRCALDFEGYRSFYRDYYSVWASEHLKPIE